MSLKKVKMLDWSAQFAYAPPQVDAVVNTEEIVRVAPSEGRGSGPFVTIKFRDGSTMQCVGTPEDFCDL
jgi:hypothetical protein